MTRRSTRAGFAALLAGGGLVVGGAAALGAQSTCVPVGPKAACVITVVSNPGTYNDDVEGYVYTPPNPWDATGVEISCGSSNHNPELLAGVVVSGILVREMVPVPSGLNCP